MPTDLSQLEDRLRAAYSDVAATVGPDDISEHPPTATTQVRWRAAARTASRRGTALAAAAAVLLIVITATVIPQLLQSGSRHSGGGQETPGHVPQSHMAYVVSASQSEQLTPVNLATGSTLKPIPLGVEGNEAGVAISPNGKMVYVLTARSQLVPVDLTSGKTDPPIDFGGISQGLVTTPDGKAAYVLQQGYGVEAVDLATRTALGFIKVHGANDFLVTPNGKTLYVLGYSYGRTPSTSLTAIDTTTNTTIATIALHTGNANGSGNLAMAPDGKTVYVAFGLNERGNPRSLASIRSTDEIIPVDVASDTAQKPIVSGTVPGFLAFQHSLTISPDSQTGYLQQSDSVIPVDLRTGAMLTPIWLPDVAGMTYDITFSPDGQSLYLILGNLKVIPIDIATGTAVQPMRLGPPRWSAGNGVFAPGSTTLYVLSYDINNKNGRCVGDRMTPIDTATGAVGKPIAIPAGFGGPDDIIFSP
jgi:DNA-binding beta-propeller fold protein YncE